MGINGKKWIKIGSFGLMMGAGLTGLVSTLIGDNTEDDYEEEVEETEEDESEDEEEE